MPRIAVLSVSAGAGHVRCAEALVAEAEARGHTARHIDVMDHVPRLFRALYADAYLRLIARQPALWGYLYHASDKKRPDALLHRMRAKIEHLNTRSVLGVLQGWQPDYIICTHFLPAALLVCMRVRKQMTCPTWVVVTDYDIHALWVQQGLSGYCAAAEEIAWRMRDRGLAEGPIAITGIPVMPAFATPPARAQCAAELGIRADRTTILMFGGGHGVGALDVLAQRLLTIPGDFQLIALAGRNSALLGKLHAVAEAHPGRLLAMGFTKTPERVMTAADLAIGKPGGLTTAECLCLGLPLLVVSPIPGQEERNADYLLDNGAGMKAHDAAGLEFRVRRLLADPQRLAALKLASARLGRPKAAGAVLDQVLAST